MSDDFHAGRHASVLARATHAVPHVALTFLVASVASWFNATGPVAEVVGVVAMIAFLLMGWHFFAHSTWLYCPDCSLCPACADVIPLDPPQAAIDHQRALRGFHRLVDRRAGLIVTVALILVGALLQGATGIMAFTMPGDVAFTACCYVGYRHSYLAPWCPQCRDDDGGDEDDLPTELVPTPLPFGEKVAA